MLTMSLITVGAVVGAVVALIILVAVLARNYIKVPPNQAAVFYGKKSKHEVIEYEPDPQNPEQERAVKKVKIQGCKVVSGGAKFRWPIVENVEYIPIDSFQLEVTLEEIPNIDGVPINVKGVATCKIMSDTASLMAAVERLLGRKTEEIESIVKENMEGQLRAVIGKMTVEELIRDREKLNNTVKQEAAEELSKIGVGIDILNIQSISDKQGYILALGQKRTAEVKKDAAIGTAEAERDAKKKSTDAQREGEVVAADNEAKIAEAERDRDVKKAQYQAAVDAERMTASQAGPKAEAVAMQDVVKEKVRITEEEQKAMIAVREQQIKVAEKEQEAKVVVPSRKKADAVEAEADGARRAQIKEAEGHRTRLQLEGEGEASKIRAVGDAEASKIRAVGLAEAEAVKAKLLAEAEGTFRKAEAYKELNQAGAMQMVLEKAPDIVKAFAPVMDAIATPMANIDKVVIIEQGGANGKTGLGKYVNNVPATLFSLMQSAEAMGFDLKGLLSKAGVSANDMMPVSTPPVPEEPAKEVVETEAVEVPEKAKDVGKGKLEEALEQMDE